MDKIWILVYVVYQSQINRHKYKKAQIHINESVSTKEYKYETINISDLVEESCPTHNTYYLEYTFQMMHFIIM